MKLTFIHDHVFLKFKGNYYSTGKLTYKQLSGYFKYANEIEVIARFKNVDYDPGDALLSTGMNITVHGVDGPLSTRGVIYRSKLIALITSIIAKTDFVISRLPSELGLLGDRVAKTLHKPILHEMVASPFDCLWYRGDFFAKIYAPILSIRIKQALLKASYVIYVTKNYLQHSYPTNGRSIGISDARVDATTNNKKPINPKKIRLGVIGNPAVKLKGIESLSKLMEKVTDVNIELQIVGGNLTSPLELKMNENKKIKQVGFISSKLEMASWFKQIDIYIQPSFTEGLPRSLVEAMSFGIPCIGSNVGGIPEIVHSNYLFKPGNVEELISLIYKLVSSENEYSILMEHSINKAKEFSLNLDNEREQFMNEFLQVELK
ncbi:glycosyltransferase family 4 protein [Pseudoalteromonas sp. H103]|uniref:glycosyltransferase family 4 protein n=1 Tax=Pseudoalteromonas sp. H103 TaxID=1761893 RepID=UPI00073206D8|nr:glycosyltransferase family 4 protein [Pseudoalteromonas sp. H103]KTF13169.1 hypothetical protein ATS74_19405 [Pseudoalteromonas sp. H103]